RFGVCISVEALVKQGEVAERSADFDVVPTQAFRERQGALGYRDCLTVLPTLVKLDGPVVERIEFLPCLRESQPPTRHYRQRQREHPHQGQLPPPPVHLRLHAQTHHAALSG